MFWLESHLKFLKGVVVIKTYNIFSFIFSFATCYIVYFTSTVLQFKQTLKINIPNQAICTEKFYYDYQGRIYPAEANKLPYPFARDLHLEKMFFKNSKPENCHISVNLISSSIPNLEKNLKHKVEVILSLENDYYRRMYPNKFNQELFQEHSKIIMSNLELVLRNPSSSDFPRLNYNLEEKKYLDNNSKKLPLISFALKDAFSVIKHQGAVFFYFMLLILFGVLYYYSNSFLRYINNKHNEC